MQWPAVAQPLGFTPKPAGDRQLVGVPLLKYVPVRRRRSVNFSVT
jgi:hypothetical protein